MTLWIVHTLIIISNIPVYGVWVYISQAIGYSRACSLFSDFPQRLCLLSTKLVSQGFPDWHQSLSIKARMHMLFLKNSGAWRSGKPELFKNITHYGPQSDISLINWQPSSKRHPISATCAVLVISVGCVQWSATITGISFQKRIKTIIIVQAAYLADCFYNLVTLELIFQILYHSSY
jgi:hypothetical protein